MASRPTARDMAALRALARQLPTLDAVAAAIARLEAELVLPRPAVHVISDVHGEDAKLRHVINNASGTLRPLVERLFADRSAAERQGLLSLLFYPVETLAALEPRLAEPVELRAFARRTVHDLAQLIRSLARRYSLAHVSRLLPDDYRAVMFELLHEPSARRDSAYVDALVDSLVHHGRALAFLRLTVHVVRDLAIGELIVAGDCYDRGPRADAVVEYLMHQPNVAFTWGNHDAAWLGACLGQDALIAHVLRVSIRYRRLSQLEEGYGITMQPLEHLVREVYADDPAERFVPRGSGLRETLMMARMQKAAAILQFKLEGQTIARNPVMAAELGHRRLLHRLDLDRGTVEVDGTAYPLRDTRFPTLDRADPYRLSHEEERCLDRLRRSFLHSARLWRHMGFLVERGAVWLERDAHLIFHGCVPVDERGEWLALEIDGAPLRGRALLDAFEGLIARAHAERRPADLDWLWYLWCGPRSPLFGKDRITTFERDLIEDRATHAETKNPYFALIHEPGFCDKVLAEFGVDPARGIIVNGHVPVKIEKGEMPLKRSGKAITIDGAFSEAYGDHGYTLVIDAERTFLALHHHFESVEAAVNDGVDIIPTLSDVRVWETPRRVGDTERGSALRAEIELLEALAAAYRTNALRQGSQPEGP